VTNSLEKELAVIIKITAKVNDVNDVFGYSCYHHQCNCNLQLHLHDLVFRFKQNHVFFCRLYKESFKKAKHILVSFFDIYI